jgi:protein SCO1/2
LGFVRRNIWTIGIVFGLLFVTLTRPFLIHRPDPLPVLTELPAFALTDHEGKPFGNEQLQAHVSVVGFVFTRCPSICPVLSAAMVKFQSHVVRSKLDDRVHLVSVTVDPEFDTPSVMAAYADKIGADTRSWRFVSGEPDEVRTFVIEGFRLAVGQRKEIAPDVFDIAHSNRLALVDRRGRVRGLYSIDDAGLEELYHRSLQLVREP